MNEFKPGLEGVVAFETEIAEPDREGGALRYRGVDIEELVGVRPYEQIWGLLVDDSFEPGMPRAQDVALPARTGSAMADLESATAALSGEWGLGQLIDITDVGYSVAYLATPYARRVTGSTLYVDGGYHAMGM